MNSSFCTVNCPKCSHEIKAELTTSLRLQSQALEELFKGTLNIISCESCEAKFYSDTSLVFTDTEQNYIIYYFPNDENFPLEQVLLEFKKVLKLDELNQLNNPDVRLTLSRQSFIEKIALHIEDLDDKVIEYLKFQIFFSQTTLDRENNDLFFNFSSSDKENLSFVVFSKQEKKAINDIKLPREVYIQMVELMEEGKVDLEQIFPTAIVSSEYIEMKK